MRRNADRDQGIARRTAARRRGALALEPDLLTIGEACRDLHFDLPAVRQVHPARAALCRLRERDGDLRGHVLAGPARRKIFELRAKVRSPAAAALAEHVLEDLVDAAEAAGAATGAANPFGPPGEGLEALETAAS